MLLLPITIVGHSGNDGPKLGRRELDAGARRRGKSLRPAAPSQDHPRRQALAGRKGIATPPRPSTGASAALLGGSGEKDGRQGGYGRTPVDEVTAVVDTGASGHERSGNAGCHQGPGRITRTAAPRPSAARAAT